MTRFAALVASILLLGETFANAAEGDWPRWLGPKGDNISRETGLLDKWPASGPDKLWSAPVGKGFASPVAADGKVYAFGTVDGKDTLFCLDAEKGDLAWKQASDRGYTGQHPGTRGSPVIEGDRIYTFGGMGDLICRELKDGKQVWMLDVLKELKADNMMWGLGCNPVISGDLIYLQGGIGGPIAVAVNKKDGTIAWKSEAQGKAGRGGTNAGYATILPINSGGVKQVAVLATTAVIGMDAATGKTLWQVPWETPPYNVHCTIPVYRDGRMFVTSGYGRGHMWVKLEGAKAQMVPDSDRKEPHDRFVPPVLDGDSLYVSAEGTLFCLNWADGKELWRNDKLQLATSAGRSPAAATS